MQSLADLFSASAQTGLFYVTDGSPKYKSIKGSSRYTINYRKRTFVGQPHSPTKNGRYRRLSYYLNVFHNVHGQYLSSGTELSLRTNHIYLPRGSFFSLKYENAKLVKHGCC